MSTPLSIPPVAGVSDQLIALINDRLRQVASTPASTPAKTPTLTVATTSSSSGITLNLSAGVIPKSNGGNGLIPSLLKDNGTSITAAGSLVTTGTVTTTGVIVGGNAVLGARGNALAPDGTAVAGLCGPTYTSAEQLLMNNLLGLVATMQIRINELEDRLGSVNGHGLFT